MAINELLYEALLNSNADYWYVAPTYRQAKEIAWRMLKSAYYKLPTELQLATNESELWVEIGNNSRISLKGADNEDALRGMPLNGIVIDEVDSMKNWEYLWHEVISPSLVDRKGWGWFIGTPKGFSNLYKLYTSKDPEYHGFHFTSYDNPYLPKDEIDKEKLRIPEDSFAQEFLADFRKHSGLIYKEFNRDIHIVEDIDLPGNDAYYRTVDFGADHPTACLWVRVHDDTWYVYDEHYEREKTIQYHAGQILAKHPQTQFVANFGDPSGKQQMLDYASHGLHLTPANKQVIDQLTGTVKVVQEKDWTVHGIDLIRQKLLINAITGKPRLYVHKNCVNLIKEFETYSWEENMKDTPVKERDDALDALRYFAVSYKNFRNRVDKQPPVFKSNSPTGY